MIIIISQCKEMIQLYYIKKVVKIYFNYGEIVRNILNNFIFNTNTRSNTNRVAFRTNPNFGFSEFSFETSWIYSKYSNFRRNPSSEFRKKKFLTVI